MKADAARVKAAQKVTLVGMMVNIGLSAGKLAAGWLGNSSAMVADGFHSLSDLVSDIAVILGFRVVAHPPDDNHNYGHGKFETFATFFVSLMLIAVGIGILYSCVTSTIAYFYGEVAPRPGLWALWAAVVSIIAKEFLYRLTAVTAKKHCSQALLANAWHHRSDALSSVAALAGIAGARYLGADWRLLDPIAALLVAGLLLATSCKIFKSSFLELTEAALDEPTQQKLVQIINRVSGVYNPHHIRTRRIGNNIAIDIHIEVDPSLTVAKAHQLSDEVEEEIFKAFGDGTCINVHVEPKGM